jgi:hypothetical protein
MAKFNRRGWLEQKFSGLNVGEMEDIDELSEDELEAMVEELEASQAAGCLNLETEAGLAELQEIVDRYTISE